MYIPVGLNGGFQYCKAATDYDTITNQSVAGEPVDVLPSELAKKESVVATVNDRTLFLGRMALTQSETVYFSLDENKPNDEITNFISVATLAQALPFDCSCRVVNALPEKFYFSQKADAESKLIGDYKVEVNGVKREFSIEQIHTTIQGLDIILDQILDDEGKVCVNWANQFIGSIDFGFYTTCLTAINKLEPLKPYCKTIPIGVSAAWKLLVDFLDRKLNYTVRIEEVDDLVKEPVINVRGVDWDISEAIDNAIKTTSAAINGQVKSYWPHRPFAKIFSAGGGEYRFGNLVLPGELTTVDDPQSAGVRGCLKKARREKTWQKNAG